MKETPVQQKPPVPGRHVIDGDVLYFRHADHGALSGRVASVGQHGCTIEHEKGDDGYMRVRWDDVLGHKERRARKLTLVERGEDGAIAEDEEGKRVFVEGEIPVEEADPLNKAIPVAMLESAAGVEASLSLRDRVAIDCALIGAGFEPSIEYIRSTYGDHWSKVPAVIPEQPELVDLEPIIKAIAEVKAHSDSALAGFRSEVAMHLSMKREGSSGSAD